ncbi:hypothetical protein B0H14DRAFT_2637820 [Mycena olivaceomarginata]|nr:hypothetical protein B0H14DRAFT_2637820 [Mycena olivaceomarginata]
MPSKHAIDEQRLIDGLPMGVITAFRSSIYNPSYVTANPHLFIANEGIDAVQLREFLDCCKSLDPISASQPLNSPPTCVKVEHDVPDVSDHSFARDACHCCRKHYCGANPNSTGRRVRNVRNPGLRIRLRLGGLGNTGYARQREVGAKYR